MTSTNELVMETEIELRLGNIIEAFDKTLQIPLKIQYCPSIHPSIIPSLAYR